MRVLLRKNFQKKIRQDYKQLMELLRMDSELQQIQAMMRKNLNERSKQKDHEDIVTILINIKKFHLKLLRSIEIHHKYDLRSHVDSRKKGEDFIFNSDNYIKLWARIIQEDQKDIEVVMEEQLMRYNSCTSKKYKKKEIVRVDDVLIKNVSISNIDNVLWNSIEKLYRVNKDFIRLSDKLESDIGPDDF
ncbi:MAG: hypothetical protein EZS28_035797 [Streblomastix strix]|uniref:Uncharacterized protein n=1 Tax=Streblomastix strix TaxID=222440 RepID=A0A5J4UGM7_9EUKA|nr:MAG: hypothetical protein EZS28_035797 [Streblomastix strix]